MGGGGAGFSFAKIKIGGKGKLTLPLVCSNKYADIVQTSSRI